MSSTSVRRFLLVELVVPVLALPMGGAGATAQEFHVDLDAENDVRFISRASIDEFEGVTDRIDGYVLLSGSVLSEGAGEGTELYVEVDLASIDTGIGLRNRHMRENYLEVEQHPYASYQGRITRVVAADGGGFRVESAGDMSIHGVTRQMQIPCDVGSEGAGYRVRCGFQVLLSDHQIEIPRIMFLKLANEIRLELDFAMVPAGDRQGGAS